MCGVYYFNLFTVVCKIGYYLYVCLSIPSILKKYSAHSLRSNQYKMDVNEALETVGGYKLWHLSIFVFLSLSSMMPISVHGLGFIFIGMYMHLDNQLC